MSISCLLQKPLASEATKRLFDTSPRTGSALHTLSKAVCTPGVMKRWLWRWSLNSSASCKTKGQRHISDGAGLEQRAKALTETSASSGGTVTTTHEGSSADLLVVTPSDRAGGSATKKSMSAVGMYRQIVVTMAHRERPTDGTGSSG